MHCVMGLKVTIWTGYVRKTYTCGYKGYFVLLTEVLPHSQVESRKAAVAWYSWTWLGCSELGSPLLKLRTGWCQYPSPGTVLADSSFGLKACFVRPEGSTLAALSPKYAWNRLHRTMKWWLHMFSVALLWGLLMSMAKLAKNSWESDEPTHLFIYLYFGGALESCCISD